MKNAASLLLGTLLLLGCQKDDITFTPQESGVVLQSFLQRNSAPTQTFTFDLGTAQYLTTQRGTTIRLPANAFLRPDGSRATGTAELRVREFYTAYDMLLADRPTSDKNFTYLASGGEFMLQVWQGSTRLRLPATAAANSPGGVIVRSRWPDTADTVRTTGLTAWGLALPAATWTNTSIPIVASGSADSLRFSAAFPLDTVSWWSIDCYWNNNLAVPRTTADFTFTTAGAATLSSRCWVKPTGVNALFLGLQGNPPAGVDTLAAMNLPEVPLGSHLTGIVLQARIDGLYYGAKNIAVQTGQTTHIPLTKLTEAEVLQRLQQL
jgi:hypothetical protein